MGLYLTRLAEVTLTGEAGSVADYAFYRMTRQNKLILTEGLTGIGVREFDGCTGLQELILPDSVTAIGESTFGGCTALETVGFGSGQTKIGINAFLGCRAQREAVLPASLCLAGILLCGLPVPVAGGSRRCPFDRSECVAWVRCPFRRACGRGGTFEAGNDRAAELAGTGE